MVEPNPNPKLDSKVPAEIDSSEGQRNPFSWFAEMRKNNPVRYDEDRKRWDVFRYDDVEHVLMDYETFISSETSDIDPPGAFPAKVMGDTDSPDHERQRGVVDDFFRPGRLRDFGSEIRSFIDERLDEALKDGSDIDIANELSTPTAIYAISELLGVPEEHRGKVAVVFNGLGGENMKNEDGAVIKLNGTTYGPDPSDIVMNYFSDLLNLRRRKPQDDLLSVIAAADETLTEAEQTTLTLFLYGAGAETSARSIDNMFWDFAEEGIYPQISDGEIDHKPAFEEALRYRTAIQSFTGRTTAEEVELNGTVIPEGEEICLWIASANRDPETFDAPDEFKPERKPNPHLGFGKGIHYCLGAPMAKLEAKIVLDAVTDRVESIKRATDTLEPLDGPKIYGFNEVPMKFHTRR